MYQYWDLKHWGELGRTGIEWPYTDSIIHTIFLNIMPSICSIMMGILFSPFDLNHAGRTTDGSIYCGRSFNTAIISATDSRQLFQSLCHIGRTCRNFVSQYFAPSTHRDSSPHDRTHYSSTCLETFSIKNHHWESREQIMFGCSDSNKNLNLSTS